ncbi:tetratricopeptide repeat protein 12 [Anabrus simplex]|uniref:tetratricopeptide repeat protein 12 n=1 Tax=Anabrus simplex TaxID=316456 RepID=UPI0034DDB175
MEEEFNNFLQKVDEVGSIINGLCSKNPQELEKAKCKADILLSDDKVFDEESLKVKLDKTVINKRSSSETPGGPEMSPDAFMAYAEKDAKERAEARRENKRIADGFTKKANTAFREGDYDKALDLYTKAIEAKRDSWLLYSNRALTYLRLGLYNRTIEDCDNVIKLNEKNMKGWLLQARAYHLLGDFSEADHCIKEAKIRNPGSLAHIEEYLQQWKEAET